MSRRRLDAELVTRGLARSRQDAQDLIAQRRVTVGGAMAEKATRQVSKSEPIHVTGPPPRFVGRGGHKLEHALASFGVDPTDKHCLDAGSSTGGFTDCLIQEGAASVVAVDVGTNQLHEHLRNNPQITVCENTDIRAVDIADYASSPQATGFDLIVGDLSFISTRSLLANFAHLLGADGDLILLVKPQFEAGRKEVSKTKGIIRDPAIWVRVLHEFIDAANNAGLVVTDLAISPITGGKGNVEFLAHLHHLDPDPQY